MGRRKLSAGKNFAFFSMPLSQLPWQVDVFCVCHSYSKTPWWPMALICAGVAMSNGDVLQSNVVTEAAAVCRSSRKDVNVRILKNDFILKYHTEH